MDSFEIRTERLVLVPPAPAHLAAYTAYCASDRSSFVGGPYTAVQAFEKFAAMAGHWTLRSFGRLVITLKDTGHPIGHVGALQLDASARPEMTWTLWEDAAESKGLAFEASQAFLQHARTDPRLTEMIIRIDTDNTRSHRLARRLGARKDDAAAPPKWMPSAVTYVLTR